MITVTAYKGCVGMAFNFIKSIKEKKEQEKREAEERARRQWEREYQWMLAQKEKKERYCKWYSLQVNNFTKLLKENDFVADWGFET